MSCLFCCCGSKPIQETEAAATDSGRQNSAELERIRGEADSASAVVDTGSPRESDRLSIANSDDDDEAIEVPAMWLMLQNLKENHYGFENVNNVHSQSNMPENHGQDDIIDDIDDLNNNNNNFNFNNNNNNMDNDNQGELLNMTDQLCDAIVTEMNLRRHEMHKSDVHLSAKLSTIAEAVNRYLNYSTLTEIPGHIYGCLAFKIKWKNVIPASLPQELFKRWCPKSDDETSPPTTDIEASRYLIVSQDYSKTFSRAKTLDFSENGATSLIMNQHYSRVGIHIEVLSPPIQAEEFLAGIVIFGDAQIGYYAELVIADEKLNAGKITPSSEFFEDWARTILENLFAEAAASMSKHRIEARKKAQDLNRMSKPLLAESKRRKKEADLLRACITESTLSNCFMTYFRPRVTCFDNLPGQIAELANSTGDLGLRELVDRIEGIIERLKNLC